MFKQEFTLYNICLNKVAILLKTLKRNPCFEFSSSPLDNPFSSLPSTVIDELIVAVCRLSGRDLKSTDLYYLMSTGRVTHFKLQTNGLTCDSLMDILVSLSFSSQNLVSLKLSEDYGTEIFSVQSDLISEVLEFVLSKSHRLEYIESSISFNLSAVRNCEHLKVLKLSYALDTNMYNFLVESDGRFCVNNSLRVLEVDEIRASPLEIAIILKHCTELVEFNVDISKGLEYLHEKELYSGSLKTQYKLQKCRLGGVYAATRDSVCIAGLTCPLLNNVGVVFNDPLTIYAFSEFKNLTSLRLWFDDEFPVSFSESVPEILKKIGRNLKTFSLMNFTDVDFAVIGINCPNLENFKTKFASGSFVQSEFTSICFRKVKSLYLGSVIDSGFPDNKAVVCGLLANCYDLEKFSVLPADGFNDSALDLVLRRNKLSKCKEFVIWDCCLSPIGIQKLASSMISLEYLKISSTLVPFIDIAAIVHAVNAEVTVIDGL